MKKMLQIIIQMISLFLIYEICAYVVDFFDFPLPATIVSMLVLFGLLVSKMIKESYINQAADLLLKYMPIMFVPAGVDILNYVDIIKNEAIKLVFILVFTTILVFFATAYTVRFVKSLQERRQAS